MRISPRQSIKLLKSQKAGKLLGGLFLILGAGFLIYGAKVTLDARGAKNWVRHDAQIQSARLETYVNDKGGKTYSIEVDYRFEWNGTPYAGRKYRLHDTARPGFDENNAIVESLLETKRDNGRYPIFVNPKNPRQSAVINAIPEKARSSNFFLGILFSLIGIFTLKPKLFRKKPNQPTEL